MHPSRRHLDTWIFRLPAIFKWKELCVVEACICMIFFGVFVCRDAWLLVEACILLCVLVVNIYFVAWDDQRRHEELGDKARCVLARLDSKCCRFFITLRA